MSEDIPTLYQLSCRQVTLRYGLLEEDIQDLIDNPDTRVPRHHQVDPRAIEAHLNILRAPTFYIDTREFSLISRRYREYYRYWLEAVESNKRRIQGTYSDSDHLQSFRAGLDRWRNGYLRTYHYFDDY